MRNGQGTRVIQESAPALPEYSAISIAFKTRHVFDVEATKDSAVGVVLRERRLDSFLHKDYDSLPSQGPMSWPDRFDVSRWKFFAAFRDDKRVGGAAAFMNCPEIYHLDGRSDIALIWDIRVDPAIRRGGIGAALLGAVESWALGNGAVGLLVETQNVNLPACRFYERYGFSLQAAIPHAYADLPEEIQLLWYKAIK
jgi:GNAT superfamily N-acetyltransferase